VTLGASDGQARRSNTEEKRGVGKRGEENREEEELQGFFVFFVFLGLI